MLLLAGNGGALGDRPAPRSALARSSAVVWGRRVSYGDKWPPAEVINAREAAWAGTRSAAEVVARLDDSHRAAVAMVESFTADEAADERFRRFVTAQMHGHYPEHLAELRAALEL
jgi:hypothetical protein